MVKTPRGTYRSNRKDILYTGYERQEKPPQVARLSTCDDSDQHVTMSQQSEQLPERFGPQHSDNSDSATPSQDLQDSTVTSAKSPVPTVTRSGRQIVKPKYLSDYVMLICVFNSVECV